jgi:hypothetical protein
MYIWKQFSFGQLNTFVLFCSFYTSVEIVPFLTYCTSHLLSSSARTSYWLLQGPLVPVACDSVCRITAVKKLVASIMVA